MRRLISRTLLAVLLLAAVSAVTASADTVTVSDITLLQAAINGATGPRTIEIAAGTHVLGLTNILVNKPDITIQGEGTLGTKIQVSGAGYRFTMSSAACTIRNLEIEKTDKVGPQNIISVGIMNNAVRDNRIHGQFVLGDAQVDRAIEVAYGTVNLQVTGNEIYGLRQPGYINGSLASPTTGTISGNFIHGTKGWVLAGADMTFSDNTWGTGASANYYDIVILDITSPPVTPGLYPDILAVSDANHAAVVEDQRPAVDVLSIVTVNAAAPTAGTGSPLEPYQTVGSAMSRVVPGGTVHVAAGTYNEAVSIGKALRLIGSGQSTTTITQGLAITAPVTSAGPVLLQDLSVLATGGPYIVDTAYGIRLDASLANLAPVTLQRMTIRSQVTGAIVYGAGIFVTANNNVIDNVQVLDCTVDGSFTHGLFIKNSSGTTGTVSHLVLSNSSFDNNVLKGGTSDYGFGLYILASNASPSLVVDGLTVTDCTFNGNYRKGLYVEALKHATFDQVTVSGCGREGIDLNLKYGAYEGLAFTDCTLTGNSLAPQYPGIPHPDLHIKGRNDGSYSGNPASVTGVSVTNSTVGLASFGNNILASGEVEVHHCTLGGAVNYTTTGCLVDATGDYWGTMVKSAIAAKTSGLVNYTPWCNSDFSICNYGFPVNNLTQGTGYLAIQPAIDAANPVGGDIIQVDAGIYPERLIIDKPVTLRGATSGVSKRGFVVPAAYAYDPATQSIIRPGTSAEQAVVAVAADGVVIDGFVVANEVCQTGGVYQDLIGIAQALAAPTGVQILNCVLGPNTSTASQDGTMGRCGLTVYGPHAAPVKLIVMHNKIFDSKGNGGGIMIVGPYGPTYHGGTVHANYFAGSVIEDNDILGNHRSGIELAGGVQGGTAWADHFVIRDNLIAGNGWFSTGDKDALKYGHGVMFIRAGSDRALADAAGSRYVRLENNVIRDNEKSGLYVGPKNRDVFGTGNVIQDNGKGTGGHSLWDGVRVDLAELYYAPGTTYTDYGFLTNVSFSDGRILGNGATGVSVMQTPTAGPVSVTCNWWGDLLGPNVPPSNPSPGSGITGLATYAPWWTTTSGPCDGYGPNTVAPVAPATCITPLYACVQVPVNFNRTDTAPVRGYSVTLTLSSSLALCGDGIVEGGFLSGIGGTKYEVLSLGAGAYTVDCAILGGSTGATGSGTLFTVNLAGAVTGTGTVTVNSVTVRDLDNAPVAGIPGPPASITIDNTAPTAVVLAAAQKKTGNDADGTTKIDLSWSGTVTPGDSVLIYRAGWGNYPEYDDVGGGVPVVPTYPPGSPWALAGTVVGASAYADETTARDFWYYVAFVKDPCGNVGPVSNRTAGTLNYHLGDVHNGLANCAGDNTVTLGQDISFLGLHYGITLTPGDPFNCLDVGPTTNYSVNARPTTDNKVNFEDLMMFAINYNLVSAPQTALRAVAAASDELWLEGPAQVTAGTTFAVSLRMKGAGDLQGLTAQLGWDHAVVEPVSVEAGGLAATQNAVVLSSVAGSVDAAVLGANRGFTGEGVLATVTFRALAQGAPGVTLAKLEARDLGNQPVGLGGVKPVAAPAAVPGVTSFAPAMPNPFRRTTTLSYALAKGGAVELTVYGVDGRKVATLASGVQEAGSYRLTWDGAGARPGLYYARLTTPEGRFTRTLVLAR